MITDMTQGKPSAVLWKFSLPMLFSAMFQQIYNIADSIIVGQICGKDALAAVGASYAITMIFMSFALGSNVGCSVVISQFFGAKKYSMTKTAINTSYISVVSLSIILTVIGCIFCRPMLWALQTPENIFADSAAYLDIYTYGLLFLFLYNICTGIFTSLGDSKTPLIFLIASSVLNIILDLVFVGSLGMGVSGAAWATFIAQGVASIAAFIVLQKRIKTIQNDGETQLFAKGMFIKICRISIPSILQNSFVSVGNLFVQVVVNGFGSAVMAGYSAAIKLNSFAITSFTTLSNGLSNYTAQNIGAGKIDRVKQGFRTAIVMCVCVSLPFTIAYTFFGNQMMGLFLGAEDADAIQSGVQFLTIASPFYFLVALKLMADGINRGACAMIWFMLSTFTDLIIRVILSFIFAGIWGSVGIWLSWPVGWVASVIVAVASYIARVWVPKKSFTDLN